MALPAGGAAASLLLTILLLGTAMAAAAARPMESPEELARIAGYGVEPVSTVLVSGQVACELCLRPASDVLLTFELPGSKVAVTCATEGPNTMDNSLFATTDEYGNFTIELPSRLHATPSMENACSVKVLELQSDSACHISDFSYGLRLSSSEDGVRSYTTGVIWLQHDNTRSDKCVQEGSKSGGK